MINSQIEVLQQAQQYLKATTTEHYQQVISPQFMSSAGAHIRHVLDHYYAIQLGLEDRIINYDVRQRGGEIEFSPEQAYNSIEQLKVFLNSLTQQQLGTIMQLTTEVAINEKQVQTVTTTLARELIFVSSHAIHHFAMVEQIAKAQKAFTPEHFGIAPATATFLRELKCAH